MKIKNNIIDMLEKEADEFNYTLSIGLKSGEVVYIDGISKGEKNGYLNFAKHSSETMLLEIDNSLWRIGASDIESINVKQSSKKSDGLLGKLSSLFLSQSKFEKATYLMWIKWFIFGAVMSIFLSLIKTVTEGDIMTVIMDPSLLKIVINNSIVYMNKIFLVIFIIMLATFIIDLLLPSNEPYKKIKPYSDYASCTRLNNAVGILMFLVFYKIIAALALRLI